MTRYSTSFLLALLTLAIMTGNTSAQTDSIRGYVNADTLHEWCQHHPATASYYVAGVLDALTMNASNDGPPVCVPKDFNLAQARDVVCKYLRDNPAKRHYNTASSVWVAQSEAWPCKK